MTTTLMLREAARRGETRTLKRLLSDITSADSAVALRSADEYGDTALHNAARSGQTEAVRLLLLRGASPHARNLWGLTPLHCAVEYAQADCLRALLDHGALVDARRNDGSTALMAALAQAASAATGVQEAAALWMARLLIAYGADPDSRDDAGRPPLHYGLWHRQARELALAAGAGVDAPDGQGRTALMHAVLRCDLPLVRSLVAAGADVNARDHEGHTPLMLLMLARLQSHPVLRELLEAGADVGARSASGETVLTLARVRGKTWWAIEELRAHGAAAAGAGAGASAGG